VTRRCRGFRIQSIFEGRRGDEDLKSKSDEFEGAGKVHLAMQIDCSVAYSQEAHFRQHLLRVLEHLDTCDRLVSRIDQVDAEVGSMLDKWKSVEEGGKSLQDACQKVLDERVRITSLTHTLEA
jgi:Sec34-like family